MKKKGSIKISKTKRVNHIKSKLKRQGKSHLKRNKPTKRLNRQSHSEKPQTEFNDGNSSDGTESPFNSRSDMIEEADELYIRNRLVAQPLLLSTLEQDRSDDDKCKGRRRKRNIPSRDRYMETNNGDGTEATVEVQYERELGERPQKRLRHLLPIKTKTGLHFRHEEDESKSDEEQEKKEKIGVSEITDNMSSEEEGDSTFEGDDSEESITGNVLGAVELVVARRERLCQEKLRIGALCSAVLESPEKKLRNLNIVLELMEEHTKDKQSQLMSVRKLATISMYEVFKDTLPEYNIKHQDYSGVKLKKDTLALYKYERDLLETYRRYLQRLERSTATLRGGKGRLSWESERSLALISLRCLCGLLVARPRFNYTLNICRSAVPLMASSVPEARKIVSDSCADIFAHDNHGEISLNLVRCINRLVKSRGSRLSGEALECLLKLRIRDIDLNEERALQIKLKNEEKHKKRIINLSKKEKKRGKKLREVERELQETRAQEDEATRKRHLTEVTRTLFLIYFRVLKSTPQSKLLAATLRGLAKFSHSINVEYYNDIVSVLSGLVDDEMISNRERILCVNAALSLLCGHGDALSLDPSRFHRHLYRSILNVHAGNSDALLPVTLDALDALHLRARLVPAAVLLAISKRIATVALQLSHGGAIAAIHSIYTFAQQSRDVARLVEATTDTEEGATEMAGRYQPYCESPELCGASATLLYELVRMRRHYHPHVRNPTAIIVEHRKMSHVQVLEKYESASQLQFVPAVPPKPLNFCSKKTSSKRFDEHRWTQSDFQKMCNHILSKVPDNIELFK